MVGEWMMDPIKIPWFRRPGPSWSLVYLVRGGSRPNLTEGSLSAAMGCFVQGSAEREKVTFTESGLPGSLPIKNVVTSAPAGRSVEGAKSNSNKGGGGGARSTGFRYGEVERRRRSEVERRWMSRRGGFGFEQREKGVRELRGKEQKPKASFALSLDGEKRPDLLNNIMEIASSKEDFQEIGLGTMMHQYFSSKRFSLVVAARRRRLDRRAPKVLENPVTAFISERDETPAAVSSDTYRDCLYWEAGRPYTLRGRGTCPLTGGFAVKWHCRINGYDPGPSEPGGLRPNGTTKLRSWPEPVSSPTASNP
ncbi:hypothetical protein M5K25_004645 [Dendrobium thyrsiflorum]|uniref:Uncharacterized protein n=1 Tax=Dendrobium thyrsiflorum TaxID=117978 RepID=A0ABD0VFP4_DENTH